MRWHLELVGRVAFQEADPPKFKHRFVDGPITVTDANVDGTWKDDAGRRTPGKAASRSGRGRRHRDPASIKTEADAANALMWEFNHPDLGYSFGKLLITTPAPLAEVAGRRQPGYNNASGDGKLWFPDAKDGTVLKTLSTGKWQRGFAVGACAVLGVHG
ncbi:MAG: hypothetical protein IPJ62_09510 [Betaproteobacteria bacterium]|nr:hypothetical protein [Betaproteobacteria bacterium]